MQRQQYTGYLLSSIHIIFKAPQAKATFRLNHALCRLATGLCVCVCFCIIINITAIKATFPLIHWLSHFCCSLTLIHRHTIYGHLTTAVSLPLNKQDKAKEASLCIFCPLHRW